MVVRRRRYVFNCDVVQSITWNIIIIKIIHPVKNVGQQRWSYLRNKTIIITLKIRSVNLLTRHKLDVGWFVQAVIGTSCLLAFALNYTIFLNTSLNSALTQTMCGNLKVRHSFGRPCGIFWINAKNVFFNQFLFFLFFFPSFFGRVGGVAWGGQFHFKNKCSMCSPHLPYVCVQHGDVKRVRILDGVLQPSQKSVLILNQSWIVGLPKSFPLVQT